MTDVFEAFAQGGYGSAPITPQGLQALRSFALVLYSRRLKDGRISDAEVTLGADNCLEFEGCKTFADVVGVLAEEMCISCWSWDEVTQTLMPQWVGGGF